MPYNKKRRFTNAVYLLVSALAIGWMVGMSVSPTVSVVISSLVTVLVAVASLIGGLNQNADNQIENTDFIKRMAEINLFPIALLTVGLAIGSCFGIYVRTHRWLGGVPDSSLKTVKNCKKKTQPKNPDMAGVLYSVKADACGDIDLKHGEQLRNALIAYGDSNTVKLVNKCKGDSLCLEAIKNIVCKTEN